MFDRGMEVVTWLLAGGVGWSRDTVGDMADCGAVGHPGEARRGTG